MHAPEEIAKRLFSRTTHGIKLGLERILSAAAHINNPHNAYSSVHVAGTNGKGSTCAYIESALRAHGVKTGLFTSPHIVRFEERFIINGRPITSAQWVEIYHDVSKCIEEMQLTFFEAVTLIAFELFRRENVEWAVFETGMGGRLDSTNIITPKVSVITSLAIDHALFLGNDIASIAYEKLGIVKKNAPLIIAEPEDAAVTALVNKQCAALESQCIFIGDDEAKDRKISGKSTSFTFKGQRFAVPLIGNYQMQNCMLAVSALQSIGFSDNEKTAQGIGSTFLPGRFQVLEMGGRIIVFDVGHNPAAACAFSGALEARFKGISICFVVGIMKDKDVSGILRHYCKKASRLILTEPKIDRAADCAFLRQQVPTNFIGKSDCRADVGDAVKLALLGSEKVICIVGSFYTVGEAMTALGVEPYGKA